MSDFLAEAFKELKLEELNEADFELTKDGLEKLDKFYDDDEASDEVVVYDDDLNNFDDEEEKVDYVGKKILDCNTCHSLTFVSDEDITIDEQTGEVNSEMECPYCHSYDGFTLVGKVCPVEEEKDDDKDAKEEKTEEEVEEKEEIDDVDESCKSKRIKNESYDLIDGTRVEVYRDYDKAKARAKELGLTEAERGNVYGVSYCFWNKSGNRNESEEVIAYYKNGEPVPLSDDEARKIARRLGAKFDDLEESKVSVNDDVNELFDANLDLSNFGGQGNDVSVLSPGGGLSKMLPVGEELDDDEEDRREQRRKDRRKARRDVRRAKRTNEPVDESIKNEDHQADNVLIKYQRWVDYDMKKYGKISKITQKALDKAGFEVVKDDHGDYEVIANTNEKLEESFKDVSVTTDDTHMEMTSDENGKVTVTTEPVCKECEEKEEVIEPLTDEDEVEIEKKSFDNENDDEVEVDFDEFDEETFESLTESFLKKTYNNVKSFKVNEEKDNGVSATKDGKIIVEGKITFNSGAQKDTKFIFEGHQATKRGKVKLIGENAQITNGKKAFTITGSIDNKKLVVESLNYNYRQKNPITHKADRIYGTVKKG